MAMSGESGVRIFGVRIDGVLCTMLMAFVCQNSTQAVAQPTPVTLKIGVYENPPKIFAGDVGQPTGFLGQLLNEIAVLENWELVPVECDWNDCLDMLDNRQIDLMPDVAISSVRDRRFDFHQTPALLSWSQVYVARGVDMVSLLDMDGKRIALLEGSIQQGYLQTLAESFALNVSWELFGSLEEAFDAVVKGEVDAVAANHNFGDMEAFRLGLTATPIIFQPSQLFYATPVGQQGDVLATLDRYLQDWQADETSRYYSILRQWSFETPATLVPLWVWWVAGLLLLALVVMLAFNVALRYQVASRTRSLAASENRLHTILNSVEAYIYIKDYRLQYQYANQKVCELFGLPLAEIIGKTDAAFFDEKTCEHLRENDLQVIRKGERVADEESNVVPGDPDEHTFLSVKLPLRNPDGTIYALCGISTDITEHRQIRNQLHQLAFFDPLTGLPNRRLILDRLTHALASHNRTGYQGALLLIDVDNFKTVNDTLGHYQGDLLLQLVARRIERGLLDTDSAGRLGADEYVLIVEDLALSIDDALSRVHVLAEALREQLSKPFDLNGTEYICSVSVGVALFSDSRGDVDELLKAADLALGAAKSSGRNIVQFFNPTMQTEVTRRTEIEKALRKAIERNQLALHLQPQVDVDGNVPAMEALLRWCDETLGDVPPADFIPVAEATGLIVPLGGWVIAEACRILADWKTEPCMVDKILAVNISSRQFHHSGFVLHIKEQLERNGVSGSRLELEVTESLLIDDMPATVAKMNELLTEGIHFALDDFGTGYASLSYLKLLPLTQLKIDQSFVRDLLIDSNDEAIVSTILALGASLELRVIAEGVETLEQAERLNGLGCHNYQGYYFGRPLPELHWRDVLRANAGKIPALPG